MSAARGICTRDFTRTEVQLRPSAAKLRHGPACATKIIKALIRAAFAVAATGAIRAEKSRLAGARIWRAAGVAFSITMSLAGIFEVSLAAAPGVPYSFAGTGQESRVRREQTHTEEKAKGSPPRPRVSKQPGNRVEPRSVHSIALHRDSMLTATPPEADSPD